MPIEHAPESWRPWLRRRRDWFATDKGLLLILAVVFGCRAVSYIGEPPRLLQHVFEVHAGWVSPAIWSVTAVLLLAALRRDYPRLETVALSAACAVLIWWGVMYLWTEPVPIRGPWPAAVDWARVVLERLMNFLTRGVMYIALGVLAVYPVWRGRFVSVKGEREWRM